MHSATDTLTIKVHEISILTWLVDKIAVTDLRKLIAND